MVEFYWYAMTYSEYNRDQIEAHRMVRSYLEDLSPAEIDDLKNHTWSYLQFRSDVDRFQERHLSGICTAKCFTSLTSACCSREGIATFFADVVINALFSSPEELDSIFYTLSSDNTGFKCVYLTDRGCLWRIKPIVCEMFLCDHAKNALAEIDESLTVEWQILRDLEKEFTWPDRPVLFDDLEIFFMDAGFDSPLMYFHKSPGLLRVKGKKR